MHQRQIMNSRIIAHKASFLELAIDSEVELTQKIKIPSAQRSALFTLLGGLLRSGSR
jgi:hypothetical protein